MKGILCFGDSITFGRGEMPSIGWCGRLKDYFERKDFHNGVYNLGISGQTSTDLLKRFEIEADTRIRLHRVDNKYLILIAIGTNDCKFDGEIPRLSEDKFRENIKSLISKSKNFKADLGFIGLTCVDEERTTPFEETIFTNERVKLFNNIIKEECNSENVKFLDMYEMMLKENYKELLADGLHPNSKGYDFMVEKIKEFIEGMI